MELRWIFLLPGFCRKFWNHLETCRLLPRPLPWWWQHLGDEWNFQVERLYLLRACSFQYEFQTLREESIRRWESFRWRTMVRNRTGIHSTRNFQQVHEMATRMAIQWLPRPSGTLLLLRRCKRLLRKNHLWHALQGMPCRWHQYLGN